MSFVRLYLNNIKDNYEKIVENKKYISVILGAPGSGKTSLMRYLEEQYEGWYVKVVDFIDIYDKDEIISNLNNKKILLLDGFDEYKANEYNKKRALRVFIKKIKRIYNKDKDIKIIIACRELEWYGDESGTNLKKYFDEEYFDADIKIFNILPLNNKQIDEFCKIKDIKNEKEFKDKFLKKGFLQTPQLFEIASNLQDSSNIDNKIKLFEKFILKAVEENNSEYPEINLSNEQIFNYLGYLAFVYMFSEITKFTDDILREIEIDDKYKFDNLKRLVGTKIFSNETFMHRTIAEFLLGRYLNYLIKNKNFNEQTIINKLKNKYSIKTEFRGVFSWLCSISKDEKFIKLDPFYQLLYGENNHFSIEFKKHILLEIKEYSENNPYFFGVDDYFVKDELKGFYVEDLDDFLKQEIKKGVELENHYLFVYDVILSSNSDILSSNIKRFLFEEIKKDFFPESFSADILRCIKYSKNDYIELLNLLKENKIKDNDNRIKIEILNHLYPENFSIDELIDVIKEFKPTSYLNICNFLYKTKEQDKIKLVETLEQEIMQQYREEYYKAIDNFKNFQRFNCAKIFLSNFYYELIHNYNGNNAKNIFDILQKMKKYYNKFQTFEIESFRIDRTKRLSDRKLQELSNKLFKYYVDNKIKNNQLNDSFVFDFRYFFHLKRPEVSKVLFEYLQKKPNIEFEIKEKLFEKIVLNNIDKNFDDKIKEFAKKNGLSEKKPKKEYPKDEEIKKMELEIEKQESQIKRWQEKKRQYFKKIDKNDFFRNLDDLKFVANIFYMGKENEWGFSNKIKEYLKEFVLVDIYDDYMTIENFLKNIESNKVFNFDTALFVSLYLNDDYNDLIKKIDNKKLKYLYLLTLNENLPLNTLKNEKFIKFADNKKFAKEAIIDVFGYYDLYNILKDDLKKANINILKKIIERSFYELDKDKLIGSFLIELNFSISLETLYELQKICSIKLLNILIKIKEQKLLTEDEIVYLFKKIFDFIRDNYQFFKKIDYRDKIFLSLNFLNIFDDSDKLEFVSGVQSDYQLTSTFVSTKLLNLLTKDELEELLDKNEISNFWKKEIRSEIYRRDSKEPSKKIDIDNLKDLKEFIKNRGILDEKDFFILIINEINNLKDRIEKNENNEKNFFFKNSNEHKKEEDCRDAFVNLLQDSTYGIIREQEIGNNRVDFECFDKVYEYKVRVECKNDGHGKLAEKVKTQLIEKYLKDKSTKYGIYLVFYFGDSKKSIEYLKEKIGEQIPNEWKDNVEVIIVDLRN